MRGRARRSKGAGRPRRPPALGDICTWTKPSRDPPVIIENRWRHARIKINIAAAGDSGAIENITPALVFSSLKAQQGLDVTASLSSVRIVGMNAYALAGVADSGGQTYPSTKLRIYTPKEDSTQGVLLSQREDSGTLDEPARLGVRYPNYLSSRVLNGASTAYFAQLEQYHTARGLLYVYCYWCNNPN